MQALKVKQYIDKKKRHKMTKRTMIFNNRTCFVVANQLNAYVSSCELSIPNISEKRSSRISSPIYVAYNNEIDLTRWQCHIASYLRMECGDR